MPRFGFDWCYVLQQRYDSIVTNMYIGFLQKDRVHMRIFFWVATYRFCSMNIYVLGYASWKACTYVEVSYKGHTHVLGFLYIWCLISLVVFSFVFRWSLSWWCMFESADWGWTNYVIKCWIVMMVLWDNLYLVQRSVTRLVCVSMINFSSATIHFQDSVFWDMYMSYLKRKHVYTQVCIIIVEYRFWHKVDQGLQWQDMAYVMNNRWSDILMKSI